MRPMIKYRGGKSKEIPQIMRFIPRFKGRYIEPFVGGGAVFFHLEPRQAIINDVNDRLMAFYRGVRDNRPWNPVTQREYMELFREQDFFAGDGSNDPAFSARDRINRAPKSLGFVRLQPVVGLTPAGKQLLMAKNKGEGIGSVQLYNETKIPNPYERQTFL